MGPSIAVNKSWLLNFLDFPAEKARSFRAQDSSMSPTIEEGNVCLIRVEKDMDLVSSGFEGIYLSKIDKTYQLRRFQKSPRNTVLVVTDNPFFMDWETPLDEFKEKIVILGKVFWAGGYI